MKKIEVGDYYKRDFIATGDKVKEIARVSGDFNSIHLDDEFAAKSVFGKRIAHGLFCVNGISMIIGNYFPGNGSIILNQEISYLRPVYINDTITISIIVSELMKNQSKMILNCICENQFGEIVVRGVTKI